MHVHIYIYIYIHIYIYIYAWSKHLGPVAVTIGHRLRFLASQRQRQRSRCVHSDLIISSLSYNPTISNVFKHIFEPSVYIYIPVRSKGID